MTNRSNRFLALALAAFATLASEVAAQAIVAPASSSDTAVRASVGIDLSNYATTSQLSALQSTVTNVDGRVTNVDGRVTNVNDRMTIIDGRVTAIQSSPQSLAWTRYFVGQMRRITGYYGDNTDVHIQQDGMLYWTYSNPPQGISNAHLGSAYAGYGNGVVIQNASGTWAANMFHVYTGGFSVSVAPVSYGPNGVPTNWGISINVPAPTDGCCAGGGFDF